MSKETPSDNVDRVTVPSFAWNDGAGLELVGICNVGCVRKENQDFMGHFERDGDVLLVVSDGMGGHQGGYEASRTAVAACGEVFLSAKPKISAYKLLSDAVRLANKRIITSAKENPLLRGMGATVVMVLVRGAEYWLGHVGDSRAYRVSDGNISQITRDHSRVQMLIDAGLLAPEKAKGHPMGHVLEFALGIDKEVEIDVSEKPFKLRDRECLLLCSDGLWGLVEDSEIAAALAGGDIAVEGQALVDLALKRGGNDNTTVAILRYTGDSPTDEYDRELDTDEVETAPEFEATEVATTVRPEHLKDLAILVAIVVAGVAGLVAIL
jgi:PPM family protein phosphatase